MIAVGSGTRSGATVLVAVVAVVVGIVEAVEVGAVGSGRERCVWYATIVGLALRKLHCLQCAKRSNGGRFVLIQARISPRETRHLL